MKTHLPALLSALLLLAPFPSLTAAPRTPESAVTPLDNSRHAAFLKQIADAHGDFDFLLVGDSITDGWPGKGKDSYAQFAAWKPLNLGVSGEHTEHVLFRLLNGELDGIHPKAAMVMIGTNNLGHAGDEKPEWAAAGVRKIIDTIHAKLPDTKILLLAIFPRGEKPEDPIKARVEATNKILATFADDKTVTFLDIGKVFLTPEGNVSKDLMPDFLHPNDKGYQLWLNAVKPTLDGMMK